jgi:LysM repeat protein
MKRAAWGLGLAAAAFLGGGCETLYNGTYGSPDPRYEEARAETSRQQLEQDVARIKAQLETVGQNEQRLDARLDKIEQEMAQGGSTRTEIEALRRDIEQLRADRDQLRRQVVDDLSREMSRILAAQGGAGRGSGNTSRQAGYEHKVKSGETLSDIAKAYGTTVGAIQRANNLKDGAVLRVGQVLFIPE